MCQRDIDNKPTKQRKTAEANNGSSTQRENPVPFGVLQLALKQKGVLVLKH